MKKSLLCIAVLLCLFSTSFAENWYYVGQEKGYSYFIDNSRVTKDEHQAMLYIKRLSPHGDYTISKNLFRRVERDATMLHWSQYDDAGNLWESASTKKPRVKVDSSNSLKKIFELIWGN